MKRILTLALTLTIMLTLAYSAGVSAASGNASITVTPPAGLVLDAGDFEAYMLFELEIHGEDYVYEPVPAVSVFLGQSGMARKYGNSPEEFRQWLQDAERSYDDDLLIGLAKDLSNSGVFDPVAGKEKSGDDILFYDLDYGYYLITGGGAREDNGRFIFSRSMLVNVPDSGGNEEIVINLKADVPEIEKEVKNDGGIWDKETDRSIGDIAEFRLTSKVPGTKGYESYIYTVTDVMSKGLTFQNDVVITISDPAGIGMPITDSGINYTTSFSTNPLTNVTTITIAFDPVDFLTLPTGWDIEILYSAILNERAVSGSEGNPNTVFLTYSNNPNWDGSGNPPTDDTPPSEVIVYTFDVNIIKVDGVDTEVLLPGAEFVLKTENGDVLWFFKAGGIYLVAETQSSGGGRTQTLVSDSNGLIRAEGLDAGIYFLEETKAPVGYNLLDADVSIEITHAGGGDYQVNGLTDGIVQVENNTGGILPGTGGMGVYVIYGAGAALAAILGAAFIVQRKRKALNIK